MLCRHFNISPFMSSVIYICNNWHTFGVNVKLIIMYGHTVKLFFLSNSTIKKNKVQVVYFTSNTALLHNLNYKNSKGHS